MQVYLAESDNDTVVVLHKQCLVLPDINLDPWSNYPRIYIRTSGLYIPGRLKGEGGGHIIF